MNPEVNTQQNNDMTPEDAKASLGIATFLQSQLLPKQQPEQLLQNAPQDTQNAPPQEQPPQTPPEQPQAPKEPEVDPMTEKMSAIEKSMTEKLDSIRKELKDDNQREMDALKKTIQDALK